MRRADSGPESAGIVTNPDPAPWRYGPVTTMVGATIFSESDSRLRLSSWYASTLPVVRIVVTPADRKSLG